MISLEAIWIGLELMAFTTGIVDTEGAIGDLSGLLSTSACMVFPGLALFAVLLAGDYSLGS